MVQKIKAWMQGKLTAICLKKYEQTIGRQKDPYRQWYLKNEDWKEKDYPPADPDVVIFADRDGEVEEKAAGVVCAFFREHPFVQLAYGDEDCLDGEGKRILPWFKPQWSPDTLDSFQYFGHFFAVRGSLLSDLDEELWRPCLDDCSGANCHELLLRLTRKITDETWIGANDETKAIAPMGKVLIHMHGEKADVARTEGEAGAGPADAGEAALISVIIPSKDNPEVLERCVAGLRRGTALSGEGGIRLSLEVVVVDNGSSPENRARLEKMAAAYDFRYLYEPMPFNFSRMCNLGAGEAKGSYLLFLNDDIEVISSDWLLLLFEKARLPHAGAVGAKLLYPGGDLIQHVGITNIKVGPVHKLLKQHDEICHYHGQNRHIYDMIGVTAACLLVSRCKYQEAGGFFQGMAVAYNDVDFCFTLHELGYYNIFRGDVALYHHESLSRGDDNFSDEKWTRLLREKDMLYGRHPALKGFDPFYSPNLAVHSNLYLPAFMYDYEKRDYYTKVSPWKKGEPLEWVNGCLTVNVEHVQEQKKLEFTERDDIYWIEGWSYVLGMDNCRYKRSLLLVGTGNTIYQARIVDRYREDVEEILSQQTHVALAGFVCRIPRGALPGDTYTVSMLAEDACSNQKLYCRTKQVLDTRRENGQSQ